jgi:peptidoglycan/LPS O-acetylase OafA/YrhL
LLPYNIFEELEKRTPIISKKKRTFRKMYSTKSNKLISLDILRGLAATFVFFYHLHLGEILAKTTGFNLFNYIDLIGTKYAVPLFFILSGYCIELSVQNTLKNKKSFNLIQFYSRRIRRIYIPYIFALIVSVIINYVVRPGYFLGFPDIFTHLFVLQGFSNSYFNTINVVLWTITIELSFYLLYPIYFYIKQIASLSISLLVIGCVSLFSIIITTYLNSNAGYAFFYFPINLFFSWCIGCTLCTLKSSEASIKQYIYLYSAITLSFLLLIFLYVDTSEIIKYNFLIILSGIILLIFLKLNSFFSKWNKILKPIQLIGLSSYSLYLLHEPLILLKGFLINLVDNGDNNLLHIGGIMLIFCLSYLAYLFIEKPTISKEKNNPIIRSIQVQAE